MSEEKRSFLDQVLKRKEVLFNSNFSAPKWAAVNFLAALAVKTEIEFKTLTVNYLRLTDHKNSPTLNYALYTFLVIFSVNFVFNLFSYFFPTFGKQDLLLNEKQMGLLNVSKSDPGFKLSPEKFSGKKEYPNPFSPLSGSFIYSDNHSNVGMSPNSLNSSCNLSLNSSSWIYDSPKSRFHTSMDSINDEKSLTNYLKEYENWEKLNQSSEDQSYQSPSNATMASFWKPNLNQSGNTSHIQDHSAILSKMSYQLSTPMPGVKSPGNGINESSPLMHSTNSKIYQKESLCYRVGIDQLQLVNWMENLRMWISQTILVRLVEEIKETNQFFAHLGLTNIKIGESGLEKIKKVAQTQTMSVLTASNEASVATMLKLIPFLEITQHQDYLVNRITELSKGGAISEFKWNAGSRFNNQNWTDKWPTDAELLMHLVACYFDCRLPPVKGVVDGKVFSTLYYFRLLDKPELAEHKVPCSIAQVSTKPPHFVLLVDDKKLELGSGRNNLMYSLLFFLHQIKTKNHGVLGRVNLGKSGINILWVID